jgi:hypothetical protein
MARKKKPKVEISGCKPRLFDNQYIISIKRCRRGYPPKMLTVNEIQNIINAAAERIKSKDCSYFVSGFVKDDGGLSFQTNDKTGDGISDS